MTYAPVGPGVALPEVSSPVEVRFGERGPQSRVTAFFRIIMVIPQFIVLFFVAIAAGVVLFIGWFGALFTGRLPQFAVEFLSGFLRWQTRVIAYGYFLTGQYPPFSLQPVAEYPVDIWVQSGKLNRWSVLFRIILVIPAGIVATVLAYGLGILSIILWAATVILGQLPESFFDATAAVIRYETRYYGYWSMLTSFYPGAIYGDGKREEAGFAPPGAMPAPAGWPAAPVGPVPTPAPEDGTPASSTPPVGAVTDAPPPLVPPTPGETTIATPGAPSPESVPPGVGQAPPAPAGPESTVPGVAPISPPPGSPPPIAPPPSVGSYGAPPAPGAPAYGTPPPYGSPPFAAPVVEAPVPWSPWRLLLSSGGRVLLTLYIIVGAIGYIGYNVFVSAATHGNNQSAFSFNGGSAVHAQNLAVDAYNTLSTSAKTYVSATTACQSQATGSTAQVQCLETADSAFSSALHVYAAKLAVIDYPSSVDNQAQNAQDAAVSAANALDSIAGSGSDAGAFNSAVQASNVQAALNRVDSTFNALNTALMNS